MSVEPRTQFDLVEDYWRQLLAADDRIAARARRGEARRRLRRTLVLAVLAVLGLAALGLAASSLLRGEDAPRVFPRPAQTEGIGPVRPGTTRVLPIRALDPVAGVAGAPWGMRLFVTEKDSACLQLGRIVDGELVALGVAGAFGNDGLTHPLPLEAEGCGGVRPGRQPVVAGVSITDSSGLATHEPDDPADRRTIAYGIAPAAAVAAVLEFGSERISHPVDEQDAGAFLFVHAGGMPERLVVRIGYGDGLECVLLLGTGPTAEDREHPLSPECIRRGSGR